MMETESDDLSKLWKHSLELLLEDKKDDATVLLKLLVSREFHPAYIEYGRLFETVEGAERRDVKQAEHWYKRAIEEGDDADARVSLGRLYFNDYNGFSDYEKCHYYFEMCIKEFSSEQMGAYFGLGLLYEFGLGVDVDSDKAIANYQKAIELGHVLARRNAARVVLRQNPIRGVAKWLHAIVICLWEAKRSGHDRRFTIDS